MNEDKLNQKSHLNGLIEQIRANRNNQSIPNPNVLNRMRELVIPERGMKQPPVNPQHGITDPGYQKPDKGMHEEEYLRYRKQLEYLNNLARQEAIAKQRGGVPQQVSNEMQMKMDQDFYRMKQDQQREQIENNIGTISEKPPGYETGYLDKIKEYMNNLGARTVFNQNQIPLIQQLMQRR